MKRPASEDAQHSLPGLYTAIPFPFSGAAAHISCKKAITSSCRLLHVWQAGHTQTGETIAFCSMFCVCTEAGTYVLRPSRWDHRKLLSTWVSDPKLLPRDPKVLQKQRVYVLSSFAWGAEVFA